MYKKQMRDYPNVRHMDAEEAYDALNSSYDPAYINAIKTHADRKRWVLIADEWKDWEEVYRAAVAKELVVTVSENNAVEILLAAMLILTALLIIVLLVG